MGALDLETKTVRLSADLQAFASEALAVQKNAPVGSLMYLTLAYQTPEQLRLALDPGLREDRMAY